MYIKRDIETEILSMSGNYPVVTLTGPRQSGKTTVARHMFPNYPYVNLEAPDILEAVKADPRKFIRQHSDGVIIDEIQRFPELLSYIQVFVDEDQKNGKFILTGSHQLSLSQAISQSLAGRTAVLQLLPLCVHELAAAGLQMDTNELLINGFYPRMFFNNIEAYKYYRDYVGTYVERDIMQIINVKNMSVFRKFLKLCAGRVGQLLNVSNLANEVGVSSHTINHWLSVLESLYIIIRLPPFFENFGKRLVKSPKLYFVDPGLACYLLGITDISQIDRDPLRGALFENMIVIDLYKINCNLGNIAELYFYRDNNQREIDLIIQQGRKLIPIEIKSSESFSRHFLSNLNLFHNITNSEQPGILIYEGLYEAKVNNNVIINYTNALNDFLQKL